MSDRPRKELIKLSRAQLAEVLGRHTWFRESRPGGQRAVLVDCDLADAALTGQDLSHSILTGSSFFGNNQSGCNFDATTAICCDFRHANLENASMVRADLRGAKFAGAVMIRANLFEADLRKGIEVTRDRKGEFRLRAPDEPPPPPSGRDFAGANLTNATLSGVIAFKADFADALMRGSRLIRAHVQGANFAGCDLAEADFTQADTRDACFRGAVLASANFEHANTAGADMEDTLSDKPRGRLLSDLHVSLEELLRLHRAFIASVGAGGAPLDLDGFDLRGSGPWAGACLTMLKASGAVFYQLDLTRAALQAAKCQGSDFRGCRLDAADMRGICLAGSRMNGASMRRVDLRALQMEQGRRMPADLSNASLRHVDLSGALLGGVRLAGADLSFANLTDVELSQVDVAGTKLVACKMSKQQMDAARAAGAVVAL